MRVSSRGLSAHLAGRIVLLDTDLFVLLVVGRVSASEIESFPATKSFFRSDFGVLVELLREARTVALTHGVLAETSNLLGRKRSTRDTRHFESLRAAALQYVESIVGTKAVITRPEFLQLGFADTALWEAASVDGHSVLTKDRRLAGMMAAARVHVVNFNDHRWAHP